MPQNSGKHCALIGSVIRLDKQLRAMEFELVFDLQQVGLHGFGMLKRLHAQHHVGLCFLDLNGFFPVGADFGIGEGQAGEFKFKHIQIFELDFFHVFELGDEILFRFQHRQRCHDL